MLKGESSKLIAKTLAGLEAPLVEELQGMGFSNVAPLRRAVEFETDQRGMVLANLNSRLSLSILLPVKTYQFKNKDDFYKGAMGIDWDRYFMVNKTFLIRATVYSRVFNNTNYPALLIKDAIADTFRKRLGKRPTIDKERPDVIIDVYVNEHECNISLNSSGDPLYMRGYRNMSFPAPLNEVLAAGMIALSGWTPKEHFINPMCGSGTLITEAAMMAAKVHPGKLRKHYAFQNWKFHNADLEKEVREDLLKNEKKDPGIQLIASDISRRAISITRNSLTQVGVIDHVNLGKMDFFKPKVETKSGFLFLNPPYGERMEEDDLLQFYNNIGQTFKHHHEDHAACLISSNFDALKKIGLKPRTKIDLFNGKIPCKFLVYELYKGSKKESGDS